MLSRHYDTNWVERKRRSFGIEALARKRPLPFRSVYSLIDDHNQDIEPCAISRCDQSDTNVQQGSVLEPQTPLDKVVSSEYFCTSQSATREPNPLILEGRCFYVSKLRVDPVQSLPVTW